MLAVAVHTGVLCVLYRGTSKLYIQYPHRVRRDRLHESQHEQKQKVPASTKTLSANLCDHLHYGKRAPRGNDGRVFHSVHRAMGNVNNILRPGFPLADNAADVLLNTADVCQHIRAQVL